MIESVFGSVFIASCLILLGIVAIAARRILASRCAPPRKEPTCLLTLLGWVWIAFGLLELLGSLGLLDLRGLLDWMQLSYMLGLSVLSCLSSWIAFSICAFVVIDIYRRRRASLQHSLLSLLTVSAERSMPLAPVVEAFAQERGWRFGRRLIRLAKLLRAGHSLPDALSCCPGLASPYEMAIIRVGDESGALVPALRQAAAHENLGGEQATALTGKILYLFFVLLFGYGVVAFLLCNIVPMFEKIFKDFDVKLPEMTQWLISLAILFNSNPLCNLFFLLFNLALIYLLVFAVLRYFGWIYWDPPGVSRLVRRLDSADILDGLMLVAGQQQPMPDGVAAMAREYPKWNIRRRLRHAADDIRTGRDWAECLLHRRLIGKPDLAILQSAQRANNLPWALHELADSNRRRFAYRLQTFLQMAYPPVILLFGVIVGGIVIGMFVPLVALIQHLA